MASLKRFCEQKVKGSSLDSFLLQLELHWVRRVSGAIPFGVDNGWSQKAPEKVELLLKVVASHVVETASRFASDIVRMHDDDINTKSDGVTLADKEKPIKDSAG
ncbi:hypothetical protein Tco_0810546 [Tanacetum coccineum]